MNIVLNKKEFLDALGINLKAVTDKSTMPILAGVLLEVKDNKLTLKTSDTNISIENTIGLLKIKEEGTTVLDAKKLYEIIKKLPEDEVSFVKKDNKINIKSGKTKISLVHLDENSFPNQPIEDINNSFEIDSNVLLDLINSTIFCIASDFTRPILSGLSFEVINKNLKVVSLDGYRLSYRTIPIDANDFSIVLPGLELKNIYKLFENINNKIKIEISKKYIEFNFNNTHIQLKLLDGKYLNYTSIIPKDFKNEFSFKRKEFLEMIERVRTIFDKEDNLIKLSINNSTITATTSSFLGEMKDEISCNIKNPLTEPFDINFNFNYLKDCLSNIKVENVIFQVIGNINPCCVVSKEDDSFLQLVLPIRIMK